MLKMKRCIIPTFIAFLILSFSSMADVFGSDDGISPVKLLMDKYDKIKMYYSLINCANMRFQKKISGLMKKKMEITDELSVLNPKSDLATNRIMKIDNIERTIADLKKEFDNKIKDVIMEITKECYSDIISYLHKYLAQHSENMEDLDNDDIDRIADGLNKLFNEQGEII